METRRTETKKDGTIMDSITENFLYQCGVCGCWTYKKALTDACEKLGEPPMPSLEDLRHLGGIVELRINGTKLVDTRGPDIRTAEEIARGGRQFLLRHHIEYRIGDSSDYPHAGSGWTPLQNAAVEKSCVVF